MLFRSTFQFMVIGFSYRKSCFNSHYWGLSNMQDIDINLLKILKVLFETRHITNTADILGVSQPSISRALAKLRQQFNDPLLVKHAHGYQLSSRAEFIQPKLEDALKNIDLLFDEPAFDPSACHNQLRFFSLAPQACHILPPFLSRLRELAPNIQLDIDAVPQDHFSALVNGKIHFVLSGMQPNFAESNLYRMEIAQQEFCLLMAENHPLAKEKITIENFKSANFAAMQLQGFDQFFPETRLRENGLLSRGEKLDVVLRLNSFALVPDLASASDLIFHLPAHLAQQFAVNRPLVTREIPEQAKTTTRKIYLYWHSRYHHDPMCVWVKSQFRSLFNMPSN